MRQKAQLVKLPLLLLLSFQALVAANNLIQSSSPVFVSFPLQALQRGLALDDEASLAETATQLALADLAPPRPELLKELRSEAVGGAASKVSVLPKVRAAVGLLPRAFAAGPPKGELSRWTTWQPIPVGVAVPIVC